MRRSLSLFLLAVLAAVPIHAIAQDPESRPASRRPRPESQPAPEGIGEEPESAPASRPQRGPGRRPRRGGQETRPTAESKPAKNDSPFLAITNATIYPVSGPVIRQGTLLIKDDKIVQVARRVQIPDGARTMDGNGKHVTPGLIAARASGTFGGGFSTGRADEKTSDQVDPFNLSMLMALSSGITTVCEGGNPSAQGTIGGFIGKHCYGTIDGVLVREPAGLFLSYPHGDMAQRVQTRELLQKAVEYKKKRDAYVAELVAGKRDAKAPASDEVSKGFVRVMDNEIPCFINGTESSELASLAELSLEFNLPLVILDAREAWTQTGKLARANVSVILAPRNRGPAGPGGNEPTRFQEAPSGWSIENGAKLEAAGIPWAVQALSTFVGTGGLPGRDLMQLNMDAAFTVRGGASEETALRSITLTAAEILRIQDKVGSLEPGKDADVVIMDLDPLDYRSYAEVVLVNGKTVYEKDKVSFFNHIQTDRSKGLKGRWWNEK